MSDLQFAHYPGRFGDIHARTLAAATPDAQPPLLCLHPAPHNGAFFATVMPMLNTERTVVAPDYPGYGESKPTANEPAIADYANAMLDLLAALRVSRIDVLGFHTGCLVGAEMALIDAARIRRLVLVDVPYFVGAERDDMYAESAMPNGEGRSHWGFHAAFTYPSDERLPQLTTPTRVIATQSGLLEPTRIAAASVPNARLIERLDISRPVFADNAELIAAEIVGALQ